MSVKPISRRAFSASCTASTLVLASGNAPRAAEMEPERPPVPEPRYGLSTKDYLLERIETAPRALSFENAGLPPQEWSTKLRAKVLELLDLDGFAPEVPAAHIESTVQKDGFRETKFHYQVEENLWCPSLLLEPGGEAEKRPAVLACHGHGIGLEDPLYPYIEGFARRGYIVLAPNVRDFGERAYEKRGPHECPFVEPFYNMLGVSSMGMKLKDLWIGLAWLRSQERVHADRIGCAGLSMGGGLSLYLSAIAPEITVSLVSGFLSTYKGLMFDKRNCQGYVVNGILEYCDLYDIAGLIAPRPLVVESGIQDPCFVHEDVLYAYARTEKIYQAFGAEKQIVLDEFEGRHMFHGKVAYPWFERFLK